MFFFLIFGWTISSSLLNRKTTSILSTNPGPEQWLFNHIQSRPSGTPPLISVALNKRMRCVIRASSAASWRTVAGWRVKKQGAGVRGCAGWSVSFEAAALTCVSEIRSQGCRGFHLKWKWRRRRPLRGTRSSFGRTKPRACPRRRRSPAWITWTRAPFAIWACTAGNQSFCRVCTRSARNACRHRRGLWPWTHRRTPALMGRPNHVSHFVYKQSTVIETCSSNPVILCLCIDDMIKCAYV